MRTTHLSYRKQARVPSRSLSRLRVSRLTAMIAMFLVTVAMLVQAGSTGVQRADAATIMNRGFWDLTGGGDPAAPAAPVLAQTPPINDDFADATLLGTDAGSLIDETNEGATAEVGEPNHAGVDGTPARSVWYQWTPLEDGNAVVEATTQPYTGNYIVMAVYTGSAVDSLTEVVADGGPSFYRTVELEFRVVAGTTYHLVVDVRDSDEPGSFDLTWAIPSPPHDDFANATVLATDVGSLSGESNAWATSEAGEPNHDGLADTPVRSVWYRWTSSFVGDAVVEITTPAIPDDWDSVLAVYTGATVDTLTEVVAKSTVGYSLQVEFGVTPGTIYYIVVDGRDAEEMGSFDLTWTTDDGIYLVTKTTDTDDGVCDADCSLREAVVAANEVSVDAVIHLPAGHYELTLDYSGVADHYGSLKVTQEDRTTTILGAGRDVTVIDATTLRTLGVSFPDRVFMVTYHAGLELIGVTVTGGYTENFSSHNDGGGIWNWNGYLTVTDCIIEGNVAGRGGGGIANHVGPATITNTIIRNNTTDAPDYTGDFNYGGGIQNTGTMLVVDSDITGNSTNKFGFGGGIANAGIVDVVNSAISGNQAPVGGGIGIDWVGATSGDEWVTTVTNSAIIDNQAHNSGGGISNNGGGILNPGTDVTAILIDSVVSGNTADGSGGGIHNNAGIVEIQRSTVSDNFANGGGSGGAILNRSTYIWMTGSLTVSNSTLSGNGATYGGGIINLDRGSTVLSDTTVTNNISFSGGGVDNGGFDSSTVTAENTIIAGNVTVAPGSEDCSGAITSLGHNLVGDGTGCPADAVGDVTTTDPMLSPLADFGGPNNTHALLPGSSAINAGATDLSVDQRGILRPQGPADDIGAFEVEHGPNAPPVLESVGDLTVDEGDTLDVTVTATDADGDNLVLWVAGEPGFVSLTDHSDGTATLSLTPGFDDAGSYPGVAVIVSDAVDTDDEIITIEVTDVNAVPVADDQLVSTWQNTPVEITLAGSDVDEDDLTYAIDALPTHGYLSGTPPVVTYIPDTGYAGEDSFTFTVFDGEATSTPGTVTITVHNVRPDPTFGTEDGTFISTFGGYGKAHAVVEQADGTILLAGWVRAWSGADADAVVAKLTHDGSLDSTFGAGGVAIVEGRDYDFYDLIVQPDGKIIAVGRSAVNVVATGDPLIARFNTDGNLDATFGSEGLVELDLDGRAAAVALQPDGKIVVGGGWGTYENLGVLRLLANGDLDFTFGTDGVTTVPNAGNDLVSDIAMQPDGSIVLVGTIDRFNEWDTQDMALVRLLPDGSLDPTFGDDGEARIDLGDAESGHGLALQPDGKILVAGDTLVPYDRDAIVVRTTSTGALDSSFGAGGVVHIPYGADFDQFNDLLLQADGTIIATGFSGAYGNRDFIVARVLPDGSLDPTFDVDGKVSHDLGGDDSAWALDVQADGKILLAGQKDEDWAVLRLVPPGVNSPPLLDAIGDQTVAEGDTLDVGITATDDDGDPLTFTISGEPEFATFTDNGDDTATLSLTPGFDDAGTYPGVTVTVSDSLDTDSETFTITISDTNRAPTADDQSVTTARDTPVGITLTGTDPDGDPLTFAIATPPAHGTLSGTAPDLTYNPSLGYFGPDTFTYTASDGDLTSAPATVSVTVALYHIYLPLVLRN